MRRVVVGVFVCVVFLATTSGGPVDGAGDVVNLLVNPGFELGTGQETLYWAPAGGPYSHPFGEINGPEGWTVWWREGFPCATAYTFETGRPEVSLTADSSRVHSGSQAVKAFTFWRCHEMGLLQQVSVEAGRYVFSAYAHAWYTNCSTEPFFGPLGEDCSTSLDAWDKLQVGVDPAGGVDPRGPSVVWGVETEQYGGYGDMLAVAVDVPADRVITVFVRSVCDNPLKHNDVYIDAAVLQREEILYLPLVVRG